MTQDFDGVWQKLSDLSRLGSELPRTQLHGVETAGHSSNGHVEVRLLDNRVDSVRVDDAWLAEIAARGSTLEASLVEAINDALEQHEAASLAALRTHPGFDRLYSGIEEVRADARAAFDRALSRATPPPTEHP